MGTSVLAISSSGPVACHRSHNDALASPMKLLARCCDLTCTLPGCKSPKHLSLAQPLGSNSARSLMPPYCMHLSSLVFIPVHLFFSLTSTHVNPFVKLNIQSFTVLGEPTNHDPTWEEKCKKVKAHWMPRNCCQLCFHFSSFFAKLLLLLLQVVSSILIELFSIFLFVLLHSIYYLS